ncbi:MAG: hypothetical protein ACYC61_22795 [Isosphaeraceae bacterium]
MADYHQIIDQVRIFVQSSDQTRSERLEQLAADYATGCAEVNQRLGRCQWLLQQGLRSEAIQLAQAEPRLLDAVATLDFRERAEWDELVGIYALTAAPKLMVEAAGFLNEAYAQEEPLLDRLVKHRRLAMQRSPLRMRIDVMRQFVALDPNNLIWGDDLRTFEIARFRQIQAEGIEAARLNDPAHIIRLLAEVQQQKWVEAPPRALLQALTKVDAHLRGQQNRAVLADLEGRLSDAFAARDPIRGRITRTEWNAQATAAPPEAGNPIWERVAPALKWLDDEDRRDATDHAYEANLAELIKMLDEPGFIAPAKLERLGQDLLSHGRGLPESIQQRFLMRLKTAEAVQTRRVRLIMTAGAAGVLVAAGVIFGALRTQARASEASRAAVSIADLTELGEIERADELIKTLERSDPGLLTYPTLIEANQRFQTAKARETDRALRFDRAMRETEQTPLEISVPKSLEQARSLARSETEKQAIANLVNKRLASLAAAREKTEVVLRPRLDDVDRQIEAIGQRLVSEPVNEIELNEWIGRVQRLLDELAPQLALAGEEVGNLAKDKAKRLEEARIRLEHLHNQSKRLEAVTTAVAYSPAALWNNAGQLTRALEECIKADPTSPRSRAFQEVVNERPLWESLVAWNRVSAGWKPMADELNPREAGARAPACGQFLDRHPVFPDAEAAGAYKRLVEAISRRTIGVDNNPIGRINRLFSDILVERVWMVTISNRQAGGRVINSHYYAPKQPIDTGSFVRFTSLISFNGKEEAHIFNFDIVSSRGLSPQSRIASDFKPMLADEARLARWEDVMHRLLTRILNEPELDSILQVAMLRRVLQSAGDGSEAFRQAFEPMKTHLDQAEVDVNVPWMNPETPGLDRIRALAARSVETSRGLLPPADRVIALRKQIERAPLQTYTPVGWLAREAGNWRLRTGSTVPKEGELWVVVPVSPKRSRMAKIGRISSSVATIGARDGGILNEGRPVFLIRENQ